MDKKLFLIFTFIIIIIMILMVDDMWKVVLFASIITNLYFILTYNEDLTSGTSQLADPIVNDTKLDLPLQNMNIYGEAYEKWDEYRKQRCDLPEPSVNTSPAECSLSIDTNNMIINQQRARDKRCSDGWASKTSDFYKYHYSDELEKEENKPWWGRTDF